MLLSLIAACAGDPEPVEAPAPEPTTPPAPAGPGELSADLPQGEFLVGLSVAPVGGLVVPLHVDLEVRETADGDEITRFDLRVVGAGDTLSEVLASTSGAPISAEGFAVDLPEFTIPAEFSITFSEIVVDATLTATSASPGGFCGDASGELVTFEIALDGSTFGAIPWADRAQGAAASCDAGPVDELPRIATCPALVEGTNADFPSGGRMRSFDLVVPAAYDPSAAWPVVFAFHGFGGRPSDLLDGTDLRAQADAFGAILVVPQADDDGGTTLFDAFGPPATNRDLVLFDDALTCVREQYTVDPDRIHATGMSNGGLMTGYLVANRSDVLASAAPMSGGVGVPMIDTGYALPALVVWGGLPDVAFEQDFNLLATQMIDLFRAEGWFVVACDHGLGHTLEASFWPWVMTFLADHPRTLAAEPYAAGLPPIFPAYCTIPD